MGGKMPEKDELVLATVRKIMKYGAFCTLDEYGDIEAFMHISEVAPRWIKNIHEFLKEGQKVVARIHRFIPEKNMIDISMKNVTEGEKRKKMEEIRLRKRGEKLIELAGSKISAKRDAINAVCEQLERAFGDIYSGLEEISFNTENALEKVKLTAEWKKVLEEVAKANIKKQEVSISAVLSLTSTSSEGINVIKKALGMAKKKAGEVVKVDIRYLGSPKYQLVLTATDYKTAEKTLAKIGDELSKYMETHEGTFAIVRK